MKKPKQFFLIITLYFFTGFTLFASCEGARISFTITELLNHDAENHNIFTCKILKTFIKNGDFESVALVEDVYVGNPKDTVYINTGGSSTAGGEKLQLNSKWLIFSKTFDSLNYSATACDFLSTQITQGNNKNCLKANGTLSKIYLDVLEQYQQIRSNKYSGNKLIYGNGKLVAEGSFKNGLPNGSWVHYNNYKTSLKKSEITYNEGKLNGTYLIFREAENYNTIIETKTYKNDLLLFREVDNFIEKYEYLTKNKRKLTSIQKDSLGVAIKHENYIELDFNGSRFYKINYRAGYYLNKILSDSSSYSPLVEGYFLNGARVGQWKFFNKKGNLVYTKNYADSLKQSSKFQTYEEDGTIRVSGIIENGNRVGVWKFYWQSQLEAMQYYNNYGNIIYEKRFYSSGGFKVTPYKNNKKHGQQLFFNSDCLISEIETYKAGGKNGISIHYNVDGSIGKMETFINSRKFSTNNNDGLGYYHNDYLNGYIVNVDLQTGTKKFEGEIWNGYRTGLWIIYNENGFYYKEYYPTDKEALMNSCGHNEPSLRESYNKEGGLISSYKYD